DCGPRLWCEPGEGGEPIAAAARVLATGGIVAIKGLGGFQLACDARYEPAVARLRAFKQRPDKPLAVMFRDLAAVERALVLEPAARRELLSPRAPIVLLRRRDDTVVAANAAPRLAELGAFLPTTPLHRLLLE